MLVQRGIRTSIECFLSCEIYYDDESQVRGRPVNSFIVAYLQSEDEDEEDATELGRTETCDLALCASFAHAIEINLSNLPDRQHILRLDIYNRVLEGIESLDEHILIARCCLDVDDLRFGKESTKDYPLFLMDEFKIEARGGCVRISWERMRSGTDKDELVEFDVHMSVLRSRDHGGRVVSQQYEIQRAHKDSPADDTPDWITVHRSNRQVIRQRQNTKELEFSRATMSKRHLCNSDDNRRLRIVLYACHSGYRSTDHSSLHRLQRSNEISCVPIGYVELSLMSLFEMDPTADSFAIQGTGTEVEDLGVVRLATNDPTTVGSYFSLHVLISSTTRYMSMTPPVEASAKPKQSKRKMISRMLNDKLGTSQLPSMPRRYEREDDAEPRYQVTPLQTGFAVGDPSGQPVAAQMAVPDQAPLSTLSLFSDDGDSTPAPPPQPPPPEPSEVSLMVPKAILPSGTPMHADLSVTNTETTRRAHPYVRVLSGGVTGVSRYDVQDDVQPSQADLWRRITPDSLFAPLVNHVDPIDAAPVSTTVEPAARSFISKSTTREKESARTPVSNDHSDSSSRGGSSSKDTDSESAYPSTAGTPVRMTRAKPSSPALRVCESRTPGAGVILDSPFR